jgi:hypothetical protein
MVEQNTVVLSDSARGVRAAAGLLRAGELVAFPTETVYGLGADARSDRAVAAIFTAKGRRPGPGSATRWFMTLLMGASPIAVDESCTPWPER